METQGRSFTGAGTSAIPYQTTNAAVPRHLGLFFYGLGAVGSRSCLKRSLSRCSIWSFAPSKRLGNVKRNHRSFFLVFLNFLLHLLLMLLAGLFVAVVLLRLSHSVTYTTASTPCDTSYTSSTFLSLMAWCTVIFTHFREGMYWLDGVLPECESQATLRCCRSLFVG